MLLGLLTLHAVVAAVAVPAARRLGTRVFWLCAVAPAATVVTAGVVAPRVLAGRPVVETLPWAPGLGLSFDLRLDAFALVMVTLVSGVGVLVFAYSASYFPADQRDLGRFAATLLGFSGAMLGLVLADNLLVLAVYWELTSITSFLLIGSSDDDPAARSAARQALLVTATGGLAMLGGFVVLGEAAGTYSLSGILADPPTSSAAAAGVLLALLGAVTKSAQVPFHFWLPAAMAAPAPVSAYLHSATMVKAGVYLIARLAPAFAGAVPGFRPLLATLGVATMLVGGWRALREVDLKLLVAHGTVSQLGFLVALLGVGLPEATFAGVALLLAHGAFKAALFLVVGVIDHQVSTRDLRELSGLGRRMPVLATVAALAAASMAGIPPLFGFVAKEAGFEAFTGGGAFDTAVLAGLVAGSILTVAYTGRFWFGAFSSTKRETSTAPRPSAAFLAPGAVLAALSLLAGLAPAAVDPLAQAAGRALVLDPGAEFPHLALWHGVTLALGLSVLVVAVGACLVAVGPRVESWQARAPRLPGAARGYEATLRALNAIARRVTGTVQSGSLPAYLTVILLTTAALPATALVRADALPALLAPPLLAESWLQAAVGAATAAAAVGVALARRRFAAVLLLGAVGYGVALLFVIQGAPDLALTQVLVETLTLVVFVLALRHLPAGFPRSDWTSARVARGTVSAIVGLFVTVFAWSRHRRGSRGPPGRPPRRATSPARCPRGTAATS